MNDVRAGRWWIKGGEGYMIPATMEQCAAEIDRLQRHSAYLSRELLAIADKVQTLGEMCKL